MFRLIGVLACALTSGCASETDQLAQEDIALLRETLPGINEICVDAFREGGLNAIPQDVRKCFPMENSKRWTGLWLDEFEGSRFCAAPADECGFETEGERVWLSFAEEIRATEKPDRYATDKLYKIEFIGRRTLKSGAFGHLGGSDREVVVEDLVRLEPVSGS